MVVDMVILKMEVEGNWGLGFMLRRSCRSKIGSIIDFILE